MTARISLCLLTWNEIHGCRQVIPNLPQGLFTQVFALDGGSSDGTVEYLEESGISVVPQVQRTYNAAYIEAIAHYSGDGIVFYHPKGTVDEASLPLVHAELVAGRDLVIASRMLPTSKNEEDDQLIRHRKWFGQGLALAASLRWNRGHMPRISDPLHGYRGCSRRFTDSLVLRPSGVTADLEMVHHAYATRASVSEIPVDESEREIGGTHFPAWKTGKALVRYLTNSS
jgi:glycosyltransferase involved in cell wall biosynthesis